jgi:transposase
MTNCEKDELPAVQLLDAYKTKQPFLEERHDLLKNVEAATPMYLKSPSRIEALLFLLFVALVVHAVIECHIRRAMRQRHLKVLPLYPEGRLCKAPSASRIMELFDNIQRHLLRKGESLVQRFDTEITATQEELLELLGLRADASCGW